MVSSELFFLAFIVAIPACAYLNCLVEQRRNPAEFDEEAGRKAIDD